MTESLLQVACCRPVEFAQDFVVRGFGYGCMEGDVGGDAPFQVARFGGRAPLGEQGFDPLHVLRRAACSSAFDNGRFQNFPYFVQFADIGATQPLLHEGIGRCGGCDECPCALPHVQESPVG